MDAIERDAKALSFGSVASHYARARPRYPDQAVKWLVERDSSRVVDLAAGTGQLTRLLTNLGHRVVAVEPSMPMIAHLNAGHSAARAVCAVAEAIPFVSGWADVVTVAQAFHWFDLRRALPEIHRVLRPGGRLGLMWNLRDETVGWVRELSGIIGSRDAQVSGIADSDRFGNDPTHGELTASSLFEPIQHKVFEYQQSLGPDDLLSLVMSRSNVVVLSDDERIEVMHSVKALCREHPDLKGSQSFILPYRTHAFRMSTMPWRE